MAIKPPEFQQEIRFAVVLYGGVSLAIYINGVAQEILRMVRSSQVDDKNDLSGTERVYREISALLTLGRKPGLKAPDDNKRARFVVDIISGTSAGGINGVALAKCLALNLPDMKELEKTWTERAQIDELFNDTVGETNSLLSGSHMYGIINDTLSSMNKSAQGENVDLADQIDLFVTATDLNGLYEPLQLTKGSVNERVHKTSFHFSFVSEQCATDLGLCARNDFESDMNPMLSFAARCTSSFPLAFEPMKFNSIRNDQLGIPRRDAENKFERFFPAYAAQDVGFKPAAANKPGGAKKKLPLGERSFADGGYLDNRPFSYAIDLIQYRASMLPVQRKLLFVDPFPEYTADHPDKENFDFIENAELAMTSLPRYQTIREDINRINKNNRTQDRLMALRDDLDASYLKRSEGKDRESFGLISTMPYPLEEEEFRQATVRSLVDQKYPESYWPYHILRKQTATNDLAEAVAQQLGFRTKGDEAYFIRLLLRFWRESTFDKNLGGAFLLDFDIEFERRRVNDLITLIDRGASKTSNGSDEIFLSALPAGRRDLRAELVKILTFLGAKRRKGVDASKKIEGTIRGDLKDSFRAAMNERDREKRYKIISDAYIGEKAAIDEVMGEIEKIYSAALRESRKRMEEILGEIPAWLERYRKYQWYDCVSLPLLDGTGAKEHTKIEVYRVSPAESALWPISVDRADKKLAGTAVAAFGGFLQKSWRRNDIMWGRLDGAERIITALLPDDDDASIRDEFVRVAQDRILCESFNEDDGEAIFTWLVERLNLKTDRRLSPDELTKRAQRFFPNGIAKIGAAPFRDFVIGQYDLPPAPGPEKVIAWTSRALGIFGKMISDLPPNQPPLEKTILGRINVVVRCVALLLTQILEFGVPERIGFALAKRWLFLLALAGLLLIAASPAIGIPGVGYVGYATIGACLLLWILQQVFVRFVLRRSPGWRTRLEKLLRPLWVKFLLGVLVVLLAIIPWAIGFCIVAKLLWSLKT